MTRLTFGLLVFALTAPLGAQDGPAQDVALPPAVREAQAVVLAAYPELRAARIAWRATETEEGFVLAAHAATEPFVDPSEQPVLIDTQAVLDVEGRVQALAIGGALSGRARLRALQRRSGPAAIVVREAGGRFVPGDAVAASALLNPALARIAGGRVVDLQFGVLAEPGAEALTWRVEVDGPDGRRVLVFEPVEGRLVGVVRR